MPLVLVSYNDAPSAMTHTLKPALLLLRALLLSVVLLSFVLQSTRAATALSCNETSVTQDAIARWTSIPVTGSTFSRDCASLRLCWLCVYTLARPSAIRKLTRASSLCLVLAHAAAVFRGEIWMVGGVSTTYYTKRLEKTTTRSDVVHSKDGSTWVEALEEAPFRRRYGHSLTTFTDQSDSVERLVLLGGFSPEPATDVWTSIDGGTCVCAGASMCVCAPLAHRDVGACEQRSGPRRQQPCRGQVAATTAPWRSPTGSGSSAVVP